MAFVLTCAGRASAADWGPAGELRIYPTGEILTAGINWSLGHGNRLTALAGYDFTDRGDAGEHQHESGGGPGFGFGVDHFFRAAPGGWFAGARGELYFLNIDWNDPGRSGSTDVTVFQPTARGGYSWPLFGSRYSATLSLNLGAEINVETHGEKVGHGGIALIGFGLGALR